MLDPLSYLRFAAALVFVLGLIGGLAWLLRRMAGARLAGSGKGRLAVVETATVDARRRLVLLRRDGVEHLVMLGPTGETVIETGIRQPGRRAAPLGLAQPADATAKQPGETP